MLWERIILETNECPEFRKSLRKPTVIGPIFIYVLGRQISPQTFSQGFQNFWNTFSWSILFLLIGLQTLFDEMLSWFDKLDLIETP